MRDLKVLPDFFGFNIGGIFMLGVLPQNPAAQIVPPGDLANNVANLLTGKCGEFVKSLYETVAAKYPQHEPHSKDFNLLDVFNTINSRSGAIVFKEVFVDGRPAGGTASGAIGHPTHPATIYISPLTYAVITDVGRTWTQYSYAMTAIHETFHLAGKNGGYSDEQMAQPFSR